MSCRAPAITCASPSTRGSPASSTTASMSCIPTPEVAADPLKFRDIKRYVDKIKEYRPKTGQSDA